MTKKNEIMTRHLKPSIEENNKELMNDLVNVMESVDQIFDQRHEIVGYVLSVSYNTKEHKEHRVAFSMAGPLKRILGDVSLGIDDANEKLKLMKAQTGTKQ